MYNVGIVGLGHVAAHQTAAIRESSTFNLLAVCDPDPGRVAMLDGLCFTFPDISDMLLLSELDAVVVATPNRLHADHGIQVLEAGKWLVVEKPLAETEDGFARVEQARNRSGGHCTLALHAAFGQEVEWYCRQRAPGTPDPSQIDSFFAQFYDPYFDDGRILSRALSLGGAWMDSGINALSVICRLIDSDHLSIRDSRLTRVEGSQCLEVQGTVEFSFSRDRKHLSSGAIDTNWTLGRDKKMTTLGFQGSDGRIVLDHSAQQVLFLSPGTRQVLFTCENDLPRLTNHYVGVFEDLARQMAAGEDNFEYGRTLHHFLFQAESWSDRKESP